jgi:predicted HTH domain antitoxin
MPVLSIDVSENIYNDINNINNIALTEIIQLGLKEFKINYALDLYKNGEISFGKAAEIAGMMEDDLSTKAYAKGMIPKYSNQTLLEELK